MLRTLTTTKGWKDKLGSVVHAYNCSWNEATGFSPFVLMFGRQPNMPLDLLLGTVTQEEPAEDRDLDFPSHVRKLKARLQEAY